MTERYVTMRDLLDDRVRQSEKELCYTFLVGFEVRNQWNYADLYREVAKVAHYPEDRINRQTSSASLSARSRFLAAFLACLSRNVVAVPVPAPELGIFFARCPA